MRCDECGDYERQVFPLPGSTHNEHVCIWCLAADDDLVEVSWDGYEYNWCIWEFLELIVYKSSDRVMPHIRQVHHLDEKTRVFIIVHPVH